MSNILGRIPAIELPLTPEIAEDQSKRNLMRLNASPALGNLRADFLEALRQPIALRGRMKRVLKIADKIASVVVPHSACKAGCSYCCHTSVAVSELEAQIISEATGIKPRRVEHRQSREEIAQYHRQPCPFLSKGSCSIYDARPMACRLMFNLADSPYYCNTDIEPEDSHVTQLNLQDLEFAYTGTFLSSGFADIRDFFPEGRPRKSGKGR
ncbi:YkgJ family cysteine cluster protein [Pseudomonas aeruginosa]